MTNKENYITDEYLKEVALIFTQSIHNLENAFLKGIVTLNVVAAFGSILFIINEETEKWAFISFLIWGWVMFSISITIALLNALYTASFRQKSIDMHSHIIFKKEYPSDQNIQDILNHQKRLFIVPLFSTITFLAGVGFILAFIVQNLLESGC